MDRDIQSVQGDGTVEDGQRGSPDTTGASQAQSCGAGCSCKSVRPAQDGAVNTQPHSSEGAVNDLATISTIGKERTVYELSHAALAGCRRLARNGTKVFAVTDQGELNIITVSEGSICRAYITYCDGLKLAEQIISASRMAIEDEL